jgi:hypothetical protein
MPSWEKLKLPTARSSPLWPGRWYKENSDRGRTDKRPFFRASGEPARRERELGEAPCSRSEARDAAIAEGVSPGAWDAAAEEAEGAPETRETGPQTALRLGLLSPAMIPESDSAVPPMVSAP